MSNTYKHSFNFHKIDEENEINPFFEDQYQSDEEAQYSSDEEDIIQSSTWHDRLDIPLTETLSTTFIWDSLIDNIENITCPSLVHDKKINRR